MSERRIREIEQRLKLAIESPSTAQREAIRSFWYPLDVKWLLRKLKEKRAETEGLR